MAKRFEINEKPFGICSDPSVLKAPQGALAEALNCNINRDGYLEPRTGANYMSLSGSALDYVTRIFEFDNDMLLYDSIEHYFEFYGNLGTVLTDEESDYPQMFPAYYDVQTSRDNLYIPTTTGVTKVENSNSIIMLKVGLMQDLVLFNGTWVGGSPYAWWLTGTYIKYVATLQRTDDNNVIVESGPSGDLIVMNTAGFTAIPQFRVYIGKSVKLYDVIRIYRTVMAASLSTLLSQYFLAKEVIVDNDMLTDGYVDLTDETKEDSLGESLYTNSENEGLLQSNHRPPIAKVIAEHNKSMFYSNVIEPARISLGVVASFNDLGTDQVHAGVRQKTGTFTNGDNTITSVSSLDGVKVGQLVVASDETVPPDTYVISYGEDWIDMSNNATASDNEPFSVKDTITIGDGTTNETYIAGDEWAYTSNTHSIYRLIKNVVESSDTYYVYATSSIYDNTGFIEIELRNRSVSDTFYVWGTNGLNGSYSKKLYPPTWNGSAFVFNVENGLKAESIPKPNRQYWSKSDQPEHVPIVNYHDIGDDSAIIATVSFKNSLMVFKDDGIYLVEGSGAYSGWTIRKINNDTVLVTANCALSIGEYVYALSNYGLVRINEYGVENVSLFYIDHNTTLDEDLSIKELAREQIQNRKDEVEVTSAYIVYDYNRDSVLISISGNYSYSYYIAVYNIKTGTFTMWQTYGVFHILARQASGFGLYFAGPYCNSSVSYFLWNENGDTADNTRVRTVLSKSGTSNITFTTGHSALVGDYVVDGSERQRILTIINPYTVTVADNTNISGSCWIKTPIVCHIRWRPAMGGTKSLRKNFVAYSLIFEGHPKAYSILFVKDGEEYGEFAINDDTVRGLVPNKYARSLYLEPYIIINETGDEWFLTGFSLEYFIQQPKGV